MKYMDFHLINDLNAVKVICDVINELIIALKPRHDARKAAYPPIKNFEPGNYKIFKQKFGLIKKDQDAIYIMSQIKRRLDRHRCPSLEEVVNIESCYRV